MASSARPEDRDTGYVASPAERKRLEAVCETAPRRSHSRWSLDPVIRNLGVHFLFGQSRVIWEYYSGTSKLDMLSERLESLEDVWWMKIPLPNQHKPPKYTMGFDLFRQMFLKRREERRRMTISDDLRKQEFAKKRESIEREAFRHVLSRVISALSAHLFSSMIRSGGVHAFLQRIGVLRRRDTVLRVEDSRLVVRDETELNEMLQGFGKIDDRPPSASKDNADAESLAASNGSLRLEEGSASDAKAAGSRRRQAHSALRARVVLQMEVLKLRLVLLLRKYEQHVAEATKRRNDCLVSLVLNVVTMVFSYLDAQKVGEVVDVRQSISRLHPRIPRSVGKNVRVHWFRHVPTAIHACACFTNIYTAASAHMAILEARPEVQGLCAIESRLAGVAAALLFTKKRDSES